MTGDIRVFKNYSPCTIHFTVRIADGSLSPIAGTGSVELTKDLHLYSILYVPKLDCNLLSISKLTRDLKCVTKFYSNLCDFQAVDSGKVIGSAEMCGGLYLLKENNLLGRQVHLSSCYQPWGERVLFLFDPNSDLVAKQLHNLGNWSMKASVPGDNLSVVISVQHPEVGNYFTASVTAKRVPSQIAGNQAWFFWLMPHKALKLWWKNVPFIEHPRYHSPAYGDEALLIDRKLECCQSSEPNKGSHEHVNGIGTHEAEAELDVNNRCFTWRDAKWPWC